MRTPRLVTLTALVVMGLIGVLLVGIIPSKGYGEIPELVPESNEAARQAYLEHGIIPLGNLFDDPKGTPLTEGILSDMFSADAEQSDLGIKLLVTGDNSGTQTIAPGISFDFTAVGGAKSKVGKIPGNDAAEAGTAIPEAGRLMPLRITGRGYHNGGPPILQQRYRQGFGLHGGGRITFDLDEIRAAGGIDPIGWRFSGTGAVSDFSIGNTHTDCDVFHMIVLVSDSEGVLSGYVNGQKVPVVRDGNGVWSFSGKIPKPFEGNDGGTGTGKPVGLTRAKFLVDVPASARWLTLVSTLANGTNKADHALWIDAQLMPIPESSDHQNKAPQDAN
ncbi:MAG: hypothetical protein JXM70_12300 [Pirellulales bacterium]|nr:hypothetical protein [Pirellulales bacterium]